MELKKFSKFLEITFTPRLSILALAFVFELK